MISREDLKQIVMLGYLSDDMLDQLIPITELLHFDKNEYIDQANKMDVNNRWKLHEADYPHKDIIEYSNKIFGDLRNEGA